MVKVAICGDAAFKIEMAKLLNLYVLMIEDILPSELSALADVRDKMKYRCAPKKSRYSVKSVLGKPERQQCGQSTILRFANCSFCDAALIGGMCQDLALRSF